MKDIAFETLKINPRPLTSPDAPYLRAVRGATPETPPVWLMRQAGRYLPEYNAVRAKHDFLTVCNTPELACEVTLQPIRRFRFDAAILFSDILVPLVPMGAQLSFGKGHGPHIANPVRNRQAVRALRTIDPRAELAPVLDAVRMIRTELPPDVALIGFAGAPFTLAAYLIEGGKPQPFANLKAMQYTESALFGELLDKLADLVAVYMQAMIAAGADAIQLFDTWAGILPEHEFRSINLPVLKRITAALRPARVPVTYFAHDNAHLVSVCGETGADVIGLDWRAAIPAARRRLGNDLALQGNLDPTVLLGAEPVIRAEARRIVDEGRAAQRHIFNLGHGILPMTPVPAVEILLDEIRKPVR